MIDGDLPAPRQYKGVMISSTFADLRRHRAALIEAIAGQDLKPVMMENDDAKPDGDVIDSSLKMVRDGAAYVGIIGHKYGQIPECPERNPGGFSLTELEFNEARRLGRPVLLFIMGEDHDIKRSEVEIDPKRIRKLEAFREGAKRLKPESTVHRVYKVFNCLRDFEVAAIQSIADLRRHLDARDMLSIPAFSDRSPAFAPATENSLPTPPAFYAQPAYIGSHEFVGRKAQLDILSDWASAADAHSVLLFEAIGGTGKSMLTWEWATRHATKVRDDWSGRFWYSFYEKGAIMADFCRHALAYMTGQPLETFQKTKTVELGEQLLLYLQSHPWLLVLDGLERVLVAYHRFDAAQLADENVGLAPDQIANRDPCDAIRTEDDDLLRSFAGASPSKLLLTSRLTPRTLLNQSGQPIQNVVRERLPGLRPADAETLFRACGVTGTPEDIQDYLQRHCDCHPLVIGVLAGLVADYLPDRGNFDAWVADPHVGEQLNLAALDLVQKRNHILYAALAALPENGLQLLSTLALLSESVDYAILTAFNPHVPPKPPEVPAPKNPEDQVLWANMSDNERMRAKHAYDQALLHRKEYDEDLRTWQESKNSRAASQKLVKTVSDLERRGLLQYDALAKRYDLHPVVRGIVAGRLRPEEREHFGHRIVDFFSQHTHFSYGEAEALEDFRFGFHIIRTLLQMGKFKEAFNAFTGDFARCLRVNLEAYAEILSLVRPFFSKDWTTLPGGLEEEKALALAENAANCLYGMGENQEALKGMIAVLLGHIRQERWPALSRALTAISIVLADENRLAQDARLRALLLELATLIGKSSIITDARLCRFFQLARMGQWNDAEEVWQQLPPRDDSWPSMSYDKGYVEGLYAMSLFWRGELTEDCLRLAEEFTRAGKERRTLRYLLRLRGDWHVSHGEWGLASKNFDEAVRMARQVGLKDTYGEARLALARFHIRQLSAPEEQAAGLAQAKNPPHLALAELWAAIGDDREARRHGLAAYKAAWADGEPYVERFELDRARALLEELGAEIPSLPPYDPLRERKPPWEEEVEVAIQELRNERKASNAVQPEDPRSEVGA